MGADGSEKWLSSGIREVRSVLGYPGELLPSRKNHLIVLTGFEDVRALRLVAECEPSALSLGVADPRDRDTAEHQRINEARRRRVENIVGRAVLFSFSAYDPLRTCEAIERRMEQEGRMNTMVAPMNTKISTRWCGFRCV